MYFKNFLQLIKRLLSIDEKVEHWHKTWFKLESFYYKNVGRFRFLNPEMLLFATHNTL